MKKKMISKVIPLLLTACLTVSALPMTALAAEDGASGSCKRFFIVSNETPEGTELGQKVSLVSQEFQKKNICSSALLLYGEASMAQDGDILVQISDSLPADGFDISAKDGILTVTAGSPSGVMYGLRHILKSCLLGKEITDVSETPDVSQRIFHLDCGRKYFTKDWIIALIKELSWLQMNQLELDFSNGTGFRFALDDMGLDIDGDGIADEDLSVLPGGVTDPDSYLTESEMDEIIAAADEYGVEIVPCLDTPGHTGWIFGKEPFKKYADNGELNVEDETSTAFMKALVKKYAAYFVSQGCTTFHVGGDEYLHGYYNWGTPVASTEGLYPAVAAYLDGLAGELKEMGITKVRSFNDPLYYKEDISTYAWQNIDEAEYWCRRMDGFNYAAPMTLAKQGLAMINGHGDFYDIMTGGDDNWTKPVGDADTKKTPAGIYAQFHNNTFAGTEQVDDQYVAGSTYFLWCDDPTQGTQDDVTASLYPRLRSASAKMHDENASGTYEAFAETFTDSVGGFTATGTLQEAALPEPEEFHTARDAAAAQKIAETIHSLGAISSLSDKKAVAEARAAYNALTKDQKLLVNADILQILTNAEQKIVKLEEAEKFSYEHDISRSIVSPIGEQAYTGKAVTPSFTVTCAGKILIKDQDYTVSYSSHINAGTAVITITGKGDYSGTKTISFTIAVQKGSTWDINGLRYQVTNTSENGTVSVTGPAAAKGSVVIKPTVQISGKTFAVTEISAKAFQKNRKLKKVTIGKNITKIGKSAFAGCQNLKSVRILSGKLTAKKVGAKAFSKLSAKASVKVPKAKKKAYRKFLYKKGLPKTAKIK